MSVKNKKPATKAPKSFLRKGDQVIVIAGADKGKKGNVVEVIIEKQRGLWTSLLRSIFPMLC